MTGKMGIFIKYEGYGYVAKSPDCSQTTPKCSGPREAADNLASAVFGKGNYKLTRRSYKVYTATRI